MPALIRRSRLICITLPLIAAFAYAVLSPFYWLASTLTFMDLSERIETPTTLTIGCNIETPYVSGVEILALQGVRRGGLMERAGAINGDEILFYERRQELFCALIKHQSRNLKIYVMREGALATLEIIVPKIETEVSQDAVDSYCSGPPHLPWWIDRGLRLILLGDSNRATHVEWGDRIDIDARR